MNNAQLAQLATLGQMTTELPSIEIAIPSYRMRMRGFGQDDSIEQGDYHIVGTNVILRKGPDASSESLGLLQNGENVFAFGDVMIDDEHMVGPNGEAELNDGSSPGIEYVHVGSQKYGAGWVAINFMDAGAGAAVAPTPTPTPQPEPKPTTPTAMTKKDKVTTFLVGGLIGVAVLGGIVLLVKHANSPRRLAPA
jgi:hypothetical protein